MADKNEPVVPGEVITQAPIPTVAAPAPPPAVVIQSHNAIPPPGAAPGGRWTTEKYMGPFSWGIGLFTCCCLCFMCCPCDERQVYSEPSGRKLLQSGGPSGRYAASVCFSAYERSGRERHRHAIAARCPLLHRPAHIANLRADMTPAALRDFFVKHPEKFNRILHNARPDALEIQDIVQFYFVLLGRIEKHIAAKSAVAIVD